MYKIYEVTISYYSDIDKTNFFSYMDILDSNEDMKEILYEKHIADYMINDIEYKEVVFDGFDVSITKNV